MADGLHPHVGHVPTRRLGLTTHVFEDVERLLVLSRPLLEDPTVVVVGEDLLVDACV